MKQFSPEAINAMTVEEITKYALLGLFTKEQKVIAFDRLIALLQRRLAKAWK